MKNLKLEKLYEGEWHTDLITSEGVTETFRGYKPVHCFGCSAIVEYNGELHLMNGDDGHFWTSCILTEEDIKVLLSICEKILTKIERKGNGGMSLRKHFRKTWNHEKFPVTIEFRKNTTPLIAIDVKGVVESFDMAWLPEFIKTLKID